MILREWVKTVATEEHKGTQIKYREAVRLEEAVGFIRDIRFKYALSRKYSGSILPLATKNADLLS